MHSFAMKVQMGDSIHQFLRPRDMCTGQSNIKRHTNPKKCDETQQNRDAGGGLTGDGLSS